MHESAGAPKKSGTKILPMQMVRFVCSHCDRPLVWAEVSVSVKCPSCGRWIKANRFWQGDASKRKRKKR